MNGQLNRAVIVGRGRGPENARHPWFVPGSRKRMHLKRVRDYLFGGVITVISMASRSPQGSLMSNHSVRLWYLARTRRR